MAAAVSHRTHAVRSEMTHCHSMGSTEAGSSARAVPETVHTAHPASVTSSNVGGALSMCCGIFAMAHGALPMDGIKILRMCRCLIRAMRGAHYVPQV